MKTAFNGKVTELCDELSSLVCEHGDTCRVMTAIAKKNAESKEESNPIGSNVNPTMMQFLAPFLKMR